MCHQLKIQLKPKMKKQELHDAIAKQLVLWIGELNWIELFRLCV
jgi:hypothetical protein